MTDIASWTGELTPNLNELTAFDSMRAFLEAYWERGLRSDEGIAMLLSNLSRSSWANGMPGDPAMWEDGRKRSPRSGRLKAMLY